MKVRSGFVSNSSSSSFIVVFSKKPNTIEDVKNDVFPGEQDDTLIGNINDISQSVNDISKRLFKDTKLVKNTELKNVLYGFEELYYYDMYNKTIPIDSEKRFYGYGKPFFGIDTFYFDKLKIVCVECTKAFLEYNELHIKVYDVVRKLTDECFDEDTVDYGSEDYYIERDLKQTYFLERHNDYKLLCRLYKKWMKINKECIKLVKICAKSHYEHILKLYPDCFIMNAEYSDNGCGWVEYVIEKNNIFDKLVNYKLRH